MVRRFMMALFGNKDPAHYILCWTLLEHKSAWFDTVDAASSYIEQLPEQDIYIGAGLTAEDRGQHKRATENEIAALVGFYADIDFGGSAKGKVRPSQQEALGFCRSMPLLPTLIVCTGHGYHAWWLFKEPHTFEDDEDRKHVKALARGWASLLQAKGKAAGFDVDSVYDLARVMRVPGTTNCKDPKEKVQVSVVSEDAGSCLSGPDDVLQFMPDG